MIQHGMYVLRRLGAVGALLALLSLSVQGAAANDYWYPYGGLSAASGWMENGDGESIGSRTIGAFGGYRFGRYAAVEVDADLFLEADHGHGQTCGPAKPPVECADEGGFSIGLAGLGLVPFDRSDAYLRAGLHYWKWDTDRKGGDSDTHWDRRPAIDDSGIGLVFGAGWQHRTWTRASLGVDYRLRQFDDAIGFDWMQTLQARISFH